MRCGRTETMKPGVIVSLQRFLGAVSTVKSMALEALMLRRYERLQETSAHDIRRITNLTTVTQGLASLCSNLAVISIVSFGSLRGLRPNHDLGHPRRLHVVDRTDSTTRCTHRWCMGQ